MNMQRGPPREQTRNTINKRSDGLLYEAETVLAAVHNERLGTKRS